MFANYIFTVGFTVYMICWSCGLAVSTHASTHLAMNEGNITYQLCAPPKPSAQMFFFCFLAYVTWPLTYHLTDVLNRAAQATKLASNKWT